MIISQLKRLKLLKSVSLGTKIKQMPTLKNCRSLSSNHLIGSPPENHQSIVISTMQLVAVFVSGFLARLGQGDLTTMETQRERERVETLGLGYN